MKNKKYHAVGIVPTSNIKTIEKDKIDTPAVKKKNQPLQAFPTPHPSVICPFPQEPSWS
jgi:hypothetical protein